MKNNILIFIGSYLPGTKSAGVTTSIKNLIDNLYGDFNFYIITADRDIGDIKQYDNVVIDKWVRYENCNIFYSSNYKKSIIEFKNIINSIEFDTYYFNGFYNYVDIARALPLYTMKLIPNKPIIIAPRGIFSMGEYKNKQLFRSIYRAIFKLFRFDKKVYWHATGIEEKEHITKFFPKSNNRIYNISDLAKVFNIKEDKVPNLTKEKGSVKIIFISRISEKKNIKFILETLNKVNGNIILDIYGMIGTEADKKYWDECKLIINNLNKNITVNYLGELESDMVGEAFRKYHIFFFPTFGENYGHVIAESIINGCPVLLSDTTPWNSLSKYNAGWIYPLSDEIEYINKLQEIIDMDNADWNLLHNGAINASKALINNDVVINEYKKFFWECIEENS
ncbi:glycosyltransferase family 4 protein [Clostridium tertium]